MNSVLLSKPDLFSFKECLWFLDRNYDECLHHIDRNNNGISKAILLNDAEYVFSVSDSDKDLLVNIEHGKTGKKNIDMLSAYVREWFDMDRDLKLFYELLRQHKKLRYMATDFAGLRLMGIADLYETLCWCIIGQQINLSFAYKLKRRLVETYGMQIKTKESSYFIFPTPETLAQVSEEALRGLQFSRQKADYIIYISKVFSEGNMSKKKLLTLKTTEERKATLISLKGIGVWTANYALMKTLRDPDCIPYGDIGLLNALSGHGLIKDRKDTRSIEKLFGKFEGWKSYLVFYLWRSLAVPSFQTK